MTPGEDAILGVNRSVCGRRWRPRLENPRSGLALAQQTALPEVVARVLAARGVTADACHGFLNPTLRAALPDPSRLRDMDRAVERIVTALDQGETIAVFGDYDVDGATSAALLQRYFNSVGGNARVYIPDRLSEGYGPNAPALLKLRSEGAGLVITVDCGTSAFAALESAAAAALDVIVIDHHAAEAQLPPCTALVNPKRFDDESGCGLLAAVGVTFLLVVGLNRALRARGWFNGRAEPDLRQWLDLVALGTVCDVVPLTGVNRALVSRGLEIMGRRANPGLAALSNIAGIDEKPGTYHAGFVLGPRINAGGRVGKSNLGVRLLTTEDPDKARSLATQLDALNRERRQLERKVEESALARLAERSEELSVVVIAAEGWHPGVIGIVASRLKERVRRPVIVIALADGIGKGSGRSIPGVDLGAAVLAARQAGLLRDGGGHPMAAGITVAADQVSALESFLCDRLGGEVARADAASLGVDGALTVAAAKPDLVAQLARIGPFGAGLAEPRFAFAASRVVHARVVGERHVRCVLTDTSGARLDGIAFRCLDSPVGPPLLQSAGRTLHVLGHLRNNAWNGRDRVQLTIDDLAFA